MSPTPYYSDDSVTIYHGDTLDVLAELEISIDAVVTDPPYASGGRTEAAKRGNDTVSNRQTQTAIAKKVTWASAPIENDQMTTVGFVWLMRAVGQAVRPMLPDGGSILSFIDWRQWPNLVGVLETCNYRVQSMIVWDKGSMGLGNGFRGQHELVCHASKGVPNVFNRSTGTVLTHRRPTPNDHPTPKPSELMRQLIEVVTPPNGLLLDPFMGSGTTLLAARNAGRRAIGIELEERYCEIAAERCGGPIRSEVGALDFGGGPKVKP